MRVPIETTSAATRVEIRPGAWLDSRLALWLAPQRLLVVADLHWGYAAAHRARGHLLPMWGDEEIDQRLRSLVSDYAPSEMLWLGDIVHAAEGAAAAERFLGTPPVPITVLAGNHDRRWRGACHRSATRGQYLFHHGDQNSGQGAADATEVIGHHHPAIAWNDGAGGTVKLPALVVAQRRIILPAFSPWAAGTDCRSIAGNDATIWAVAPKRIFVVNTRTRVPPAA